MRNDSASVADAMQRRGVEMAGGELDQVVLMDGCESCRWGLGWIVWSRLTSDRRHATAGLVGWRLVFVAEKYNRSVC